ncbi:hypothetical protein, partial [Alistipes finegoldii]|uniref:hypothetical protein n=1 Tax=Alistipes finegoldii TaxID=214856 RepID=UPI003AADC83C
FFHASGIHTVLFGRCPHTFHTGFTQAAESRIFHSELMQFPADQLVAMFASFRPPSPGAF